MTINEAIPVHVGDEARHLKTRLIGTVVRVGSNIAVDMGSKDIVVPASQFHKEFLLLGKYEGKMSAKDMINRVVEGKDPKSAVDEALPHSMTVGTWDYGDLAKRAKAGGNNLLNLMKTVSGNKTWTATPIEKEWKDASKAMEDLDNALLKLQQKAEKLSKGQK